MARATIIYTDGRRKPVITTAFDGMKADAKAQKEGWNIQGFRTQLYEYYAHLRSTGDVAMGFEQWAREVEGFAPYNDTDDDGDDLGEGNGPDGPTGA